MIYPMICTACGQRTEIVWPAADYDALPRFCKRIMPADTSVQRESEPFCWGKLEPDYAQAPGIAFKGRGWTPKHYA